MDKTLLILGAGASKDFCEIFPTGLELIKDINYHFLTEHRYPTDVRKGKYLSSLMNLISKNFGDDERLFKQIKNELWDIQLDYEWHNLRLNPINPVSIDRFISSKIKERKLVPEAKNIIKYSIYYLIKGTEQAISEGHHSLNQTWMNALANKFTGYTFEKLQQNLQVVTFNYDRTFESFFLNGLKSIISLSDSQIAQFQNSVNHIYGSLGNLNEIPLELKNDAFTTIRGKYTNIKLIDDRSGQLSLPDAEEYKNVHFLGFGFDPDNISTLNLNQFKAATFKGLTYKYAKPRIEKLKSDFNIVGINCSCLEYVNNHIG